MNTKTKGIVAGVAGAALLLGAGGTLALWHDVADVPGGVIRDGLLDVEAQPMQWYDVSPDRGDVQDLSPEVGSALRWDASWIGQEQTVWNGVTTQFQTLDPDGTGGATGDIVGHPINLEEWQAVPGDFMLGQTRVTAITEGDNMEAELRVDGAYVDGELAQGLGLKYVVTDWDGNVMDGAHDLTEPADLHFAGAGPKDVQVFVLATLPRDIDHQDLIATEANLQQLNVVLEQIR